MAEPTAVIYARYSSELQAQASIEDQIGLCRALAERLGCRVGEVFADRAMSAATSLRPGYQALLASVRARARSIWCWRRAWTGCRATRRTWPPSTSG